MKRADELPEPIPLMPPPLIRSVRPEANAPLPLGLNAESGSTCEPVHWKLR